MSDQSRNTFGNLVVVQGSAGMSPNVPGRAASRTAGRTTPAGGFAYRTARTTVLAAAVSVTALSLSADVASAQWSVLGKNIPQLEDAYRNGLTTATSVVNQYLDRINVYNTNNDRGTGGIRAVAQVNPNVLAEAAAVDALIAGGATTAQYPLLGVPVIIKDSYNVAGIRTTNGVSVLNGQGPSATSTTLIPSTDAFSVAQLKAAGAIIIGKAAQTTMAYAYDGVDNNFGYVRNPYQPNRWPGGSSSGSGAGIASEFAMLAMGGETGGSIRVPANANNLVGLKTSLGLIDPGGTWPLTPSRDVVGPLGKTVADIAYAMNALVKPSPTNLFNNTPFYPDPAATPGTVRPADYTTALVTNSLQGKVLAVPRSILGTSTTSGGLTYSTGGYEGGVAPAVLAQFNATIAKLKSEGARVVYVDIPGSVNYYTTIGRSSRATTDGFKYDYPTTVVVDTNTAGGVTTYANRNAPDNTWSSWAAAFYYNSLIQSYNDPKIRNIRDFANALLAGRNATVGYSASTTPGLSGAYTNINNLANIWEAGNARGFGDLNNDGVPDNPDAIRALAAFNQVRLNDYEGFLNAPNLVDDPSTPDIDESTIGRIDAVISPTYGRIMQLATFSSRVPGYATTDDPSWSITGAGSLLGRFESNILGAPSLSMPMGFFPDGTPMGFQFIGRLGGEYDLLSYAYDYEQAYNANWIAPNLSFVPEPGAVGLLMLSAAGLMRRRRSDSPMVAK